MKLPVKEIMLIVITAIVTSFFTINYNNKQLIKAKEIEYLDKLDEYLSDYLSLAMDNAWGDTPFSQVNRQKLLKLSIRITLILERNFANPHSENYIGAISEFSEFNHRIFTEYIISGKVNSAYYENYLNLTQKISKVHLRYTIVEYDYINKVNFLDVFSSNNDKEDAYVDIWSQIDTTIINQRPFSKKWIEEHNQLVDSLKVQLR